MTLASLGTAGDGGFRCCLSWARDPERSDLPATLGGLFTLRRGRTSWGFPCWVVHAPLVSAEDAQRHLAALLHWLRRSGATVVEFRQVPREGRLHDVLAEALREHRSTVYARDLPTSGGGDGPSLRNVAIGLGTLGRMWVSILPLLDRAKRRIAASSRIQSPPIAA